jgi:hypothetical protein
MTSALERAPAEAAKPAQVATLTFPDGKTYSLPLLTDHAGALFLDIRKMQGETGACCIARGTEECARCGRPGAPRPSHAPAPTSLPLLSACCRRVHL